MADAVPKLSALARNFKPGIYKHFKGDLYEALLVARSSEYRGKEFVIYRSLEKGYVWVRPIEMFFEKIKRADYRGPRFVWVRKKK